MAVHPRERTETMTPMAEISLESARPKTNQQAEMEFFSISNGQWPYGLMIFNRTPPLVPWLANCNNLHQFNCPQIFFGSYQFLHLSLLVAVEVLRGFNLETYPTGINWGHDGIDQGPCFKLPYGVLQFAHSWPTPWWWAIVLDMANWVDMPWKDTRHNRSNVI